MGRHSLTVTRLPDTAILVIACNRAGYLARCLQSLFRYLPDTGIPVFVSQDGCHRKVSRTIQQHSQRVIHMQHLGRLPPQLLATHTPGYYRIARHYGWALGRIFDATDYQYVIVIEDDLEIAPDFFDYFEAMTPLLRADPSIWCISAWHDNGYQAYVGDAQAFYRSDFFPGLGWLLSRDIWHELESSWPDGFWDEWMRAPAQRKNRVCIRPEISRSRTFGRWGVSHGQYYRRYLAPIVLNQQTVNFAELDVHQLQKDAYDQRLFAQVHRAREVQLNALSGLNAGVGQKAGDVKVCYGTDQEFVAIARTLGLLEDFWSGIPRASYRGVVTLRLQQQQLFIVPRNFTP